METPNNMVRSSQRFCEKGKTDVTLWSPPIIVSGGPSIVCSFFAPFKLVLR